MLYLLELLIALAPTYVLRFQLAGRSVNLLEILLVLFWVIFAVWLFNGRINDFRYFIKNQPKTFLFAAGLFLLAALISVIVSVERSRALGQFIAFFLQPMLTYFIAAYILREDREKQHFIKFLFILLALFSLYAIIQYATLLGLPQAWWGNTNEPKRALSVFEYPNAFALFSAPLLALCLPFLFEKKFVVYGKPALFAIGVIGLILSLSRGAWAGFFVAVPLFVILLRNASETAKRVKYTLVGMLIIFGIAIAVIPPLRYRIVLPFLGEKSTVSRYSLWHTANKMIADAPITGKGLYGYKTNFDKYNTDPNLQSLNYPHNIFLNFWVETGLLGLFSFLLLCGWKIVQAIKYLRREHAAQLAFGPTLKIGLLLFFAALFVHGLVDAPYFKNDLALVFWTVLALA